MQQDLVWNAAWAGLTESLCCLEVLPFTPLHYVRLACARSPFVCGGREPNETDCANFLWAVSPLYDPRSKWKKFKHWTAYFRAIRKFTLEEAVIGIDDYMEESWQDSPPVQVGAKRSKAYFSPVVSLMRKLCPAYNLTPAAIMAMPYKQIFQLAKPLSAADGVPLSAPADAAKVRERHKAPRHD